MTGCPRETGLLLRAGTELVPPCTRAEGPTRISGAQDTSAALGHSSPKRKGRPRHSFSARLQIPGPLAYCLFQRWLNYPDTGLRGALTWFPPCVGPHTSASFWGRLASQNQEGSCLPSSPLRNTQYRGQQVEFQVLSLDHIAPPSRKPPSAANSQSGRPLPWRPCTTLPGHTEGHGPFSPESVGPKGVGSKGARNSPR